VVHIKRETEDLNFIRSFTEYFPEELDFDKDIELEERNDLTIRKD